MDAQLSPAARIAEGLELTSSGVRCGGDISDGLLVELERITDMSGCGAEIWLDRLPVEPALVSDFGSAWPDLAVGGGEDFELVVDRCRPRRCRHCWPPGRPTWRR